MSDESEFQQDLDVFFDLLEKRGSQELKEFWKNVSDPQSSQSQES